HLVGYAQGVSHQGLVESVNEGVVEASPAKPTAPWRTALRNAADVLCERQPAQDIGSLRMAEHDHPTPGISLLDRAHRRGGEQRIADTRNNDEQKRRIAGGHQTRVSRFPVELSASPETSGPPHSLRILLPILSQKRALIPAIT